MWRQIIFLSTVFGRQPFFQKEDQDCPDKDIYEECAALCRQEYSRCRLLCETEYCQSICDREYESCLDNCPCGAYCAEGCKKCDHPLCPEITTYFSTTAPLPSEVVIMVIPEDHRKSYMISKDGTNVIPARIQNSPIDATNAAKAAIINGQQFIFGGISNTRKIGRLDGCSFFLLPIQLINERSFSHSAVSFDSGSKALICFDAFDKSCEIFDGMNVFPSFSTATSHGDGGLGLYKNQPTTVSALYRDGWGVVETMTESGWERLTRHPQDIERHCLVGLDSGDLLVIGGSIVFGGEILDDIWRLNDNSWEIIGKLNKAIADGSSIMLEESIFIIPGTQGIKDDFPIQRIDMTEDEEIRKIEIIGSHSAYYSTPVVTFPNDNC